MKRLLELVWELFKISLFVIGGGYAIIAVADRVFARKRWTEDGELLDHLPIFQMIPGLLAAHTAVYVGRKVAGWRGSLFGVMAVAAPSVVIFLLVSVGYDRLPLDNRWVKAAFIGLRSSLTGIIAATIVRSWLRAKKDLFFYSLLAAVLGAVVGLGVGVPWALVGAMAVGLLSSFVRGPVEGEKRFNVSWLPLLVFVKYGLLGVGGGFVLVPMYIEDFVGATAPYLQIPDLEFFNVIALSQMTPGPVGVNCATFFGYRLAGVAGSVLASAMLLLPGSLLLYGVLVSLDKFRENPVVKGIFRGVRPASIALMLIALAAFAKTSFVSVPAVLLAIVGAVLSYSRKVNVVHIILGSALVGMLCLGLQT